MARIYTTAHGKPIDMDRLRVANEETIAVGNMKVNARGDKLGTGGEVSETRNQVQSNYNKLNTPVPVEIAPETASASTVASGAKVRQGAPVDLAQIPTPVERTEPVAEESVAAVPNLRSQLAQSLAAPASVKQEPLKDPRKPTGPARI
jgi:hypothetical protein